MEGKIRENKEEAIELAVAQIEKEFGKGAIMRLGTDQPIPDIPVIPTGALSLDLALGVGGVPRGRVVEVYGPESSGKTTLALHIITEAQKKGGVAVFVDAEHAMDAAYAKRIGVDLDHLLISQPDTGEQALEITDVLIKTGSIDIVVIDSVAALVPRAELEGEMGDTQVGLQARLMSKALRKLSASISRTQCCAMFTNQIREKIGVMFGSPETTPGGRALKFYASVRLDIRRIGTLKEGQTVVGSRTRVKVVKNKIAPPFRQAEFDIMYTHGISKEGCLLDLGLEYKVLQKSGTWLSYGEDRLGQGREKSRKTLQERPDLADKLESEIQNKAREEGVFLVSAERIDDEESEEETS